ncbi:thiol-disulfide oxidoreductase ResA [Desmospora profundinema]|uniref:Peroxiredoxin n=1 Tax=Desmospora profundinema TaxID=1571184 RepID=A0ABU1IJW3_9BACL|nr:thiol-disulfide oxidoreductase ResA [Desmospora profundinema]MDR6224827.1 peroxiredoxin [Desmospora profundinema]
MNHRTRYWVRRVLMLVMAGLVGFALYQALAEEKVGTTVGEQAPDFELQTLDGDTLKLSDLEGKAVLVNFWATWCKPCRDEMPAIQSVYNRYKDQDFVVVGVNIAETPVSVKAFARQLELDFPIVLDRNREVTRLYNIGPIPSSVLLDKDGKVVRKHDGQMVEGQIEGYAREALDR